MAATLASINIFPLKSGAALARAEARIEPRGLERDRRWMVIEAGNEFLTGRVEPRLTLIRAQPGDGFIELDAPGMPTLVLVEPVAGGERIDTAVWNAAVSPLLADGDAHAWISRFLRRSCRLVHMDVTTHRAVKAKYDGRYGQDGDEVSFADAFPLLLVSQAALDLLNARLVRPVPMLRFRPNLVVAGTLPHAEDDWKRVRIGAIEFDVVKPCTRCIFTTVDFEIGVTDPSGEPLRTLAGYRRSAAGVTFGQNLIPRGTGSLAVGDPIVVIV